jgi:hypothetical protein
MGVKAFVVVGRLIIFNIRLGGEGYLGDIVL